MKKGFTMIELIFVIVILGILAAIAIPRLAATRDDAEISKALNNVNTLVTDVGAYYTSQGDFAAFDQMTNVALEGVSKDNTTGATSGYMMVTGDKCLKVTITPARWVAGSAYVDSLKIENGTATKNACKAVQSNAQVVKMVNAEFASKKCKTLADEGNGCKEWDTTDEIIKGFPASGLKVVF